MDSLENKNHAIEQQIENEKSIVDYDTREFTIEYIVDKYSKDIDSEKMSFLFRNIREILYGASSGNQN